MKAISEITRTPQQLSMINRIGSVNPERTRQITAMAWSWFNNYVNGLATNCSPVSRPSTSAL